MDLQHGRHHKVLLKLPKRPCRPLYLFKWKKIESGQALGPFEFNNPYDLFDRRLLKSCEIILPIYDFDKDGEM
jgi:hypothetical protein